LTAIGLACQHFWIRKIDARRLRRDFYFRAVEQPCQQILTDFSMLEEYIWRWGRESPLIEAVEVQAKAVHLNRNLNKTINNIAELEQTATETWLDVASEGFEEVIADLSDERRSLGTRGDRPK
jgi:hypothetical protein